MYCIRLPFTLFSILSSIILRGTRIPRCLPTFDMYRVQMPSLMYLIFAQKQRIIFRVRWLGKTFFIRITSNSASHSAPFLPDIEPLYMSEKTKTSEAKAIEIHQTGVCIMTHTPTKSPVGRATLNATIGIEEEKRPPAHLVG